MGLFSSIGKAFKKVFKGIGKVFKAIGKGIKKVVKGIGNMVKGALKGDFMSILMIAAAVYTGGAMLGAWSSPFASINGILAPGVEGAASYANAIGASATGAGSQSAMLAAQTAEFGAAGLQATASSAAYGGASTALGAITGNMPTGFDATSKVLDPDMGAWGQEGAQTAIDPLDPLAGNDASWGINQRATEGGLWDVPVEGSDGLFQLPDAGAPVTDLSRSASMWDKVTANTIGENPWVRGAVDLGSKAIDVMNKVPSPVWSFASGLFTPDEAEVAQATAQAGWQAKKDQMDYSSPGYVPTVRPSGQGLLGAPGGPNAGVTAQRPSHSQNILPPEEQAIAVQMGLSPYQYLYMKRSGQI